MTRVFTTLTTQIILGAPRQFSVLFTQLSARFGQIICVGLCSLLAQAAAADEVDDFLKAKMAERDIPGLQVAVVKNQEVVKQASYGIANVSDNIAVDDKTLFALNSMTKAFVGVAVMQLVEQGKLDLAKPVGHYLPDLPEAWQTVTIRQLMTHNSGLPDVMDSNANLRSSKGWDESWALTLQAPLEFTADTQFRYTQTNYVLIGKIIDKLSGKPFTDFIREQQFNKVDMKRTSEGGFSHYQGIASHSARGYTTFITGALTHIWEDFPPPIRTASGMSSTASELADWIIALQNGELLYKPESLKVLWSPSILQDGKTAGWGGKLNGYAIGWPMFVRDEHPAAVAIGGGRSAMAVYYQDDVAVVILTNLQGGFPERYIDEVAAFYFGQQDNEKNKTDK